MVASNNRTQRVFFSCFVFCSYNHEANENHCTGAQNNSMHGMCEHNKNKQKKQRTWQKHICKRVAEIKVWVVLLSFQLSLSLSVSIYVVAVRFLGGGRGLSSPHFMLFLWVYNRTGGAKCSPDFQLNSGSYWSDCFSAARCGAIKGGTGV